MTAARAIPRADDDGDIARLAAERRPFVFSTERLSIDRFLDQYGDSRLRISFEEWRLPLSLMTMRAREYYEYCKRFEELEQSVDSEMIPYAFHDVTGQDPYEGHLPRVTSSSDDPLAALVWDVKFPAFIQEISSVFTCTAARVAFGPTGSRADIHTHGAAVNRLLHGEKTWRVHHPYVASAIAQITRSLKVKNRLLFFEREILPLAESGVGDIAPALFEKFVEWSEDGICARPMIEDPAWHLPLLAELVRGIAFSQRAGEAVYLPPNWAHAVENRSWALCAIYEFRAPSQETLADALTRRLDREGARLSMLPDRRISVKGDEMMVDGPPTILRGSATLLEILRHVDGQRTAADVAELCADPQAALDILEDLDGVLVARVKSQTAYDVDDWDQQYRSGAYARTWESGTPAMSTIALFSAGLVPPGSDVLDVGCGAGTDAVFLAKLGFRVHAVDLSSKAIEIARFAARSSGVEIDFRCESVTSLSFDDASVSAALDRGCLHSLPPSSWRAYFDELYRVLRPRGHLVIIGCRRPTEHFTSIRYESIVQIADRFVVERFEDTTMATSTGQMPVGFVLLRSKRQP